MLVQLKRVIAALTAALIVPASALAQDGPPGEDADDYVLEVGPGLFVAPRYPGADHYRVLPLPLLRFAYRDLVFASVEGVGINLLRTEAGFRAGPIAGIDFGRSGKDTRKYVPGLSKVGIAPELGGFIAYDTMGGIGFDLQVRQALGGHDGLTADLAVNYRAILGDSTVAMIGPKVTWTSGRYNRSFFGVTEDQAADSRFEAYDPGAGITGAGVNAAVIRTLGGNWSLAFFGSYTRLLGEAKDSPVTKAESGSADQFTAGLAISYRFGWN